MSDIEKLQKLIDNSDNIVFFGGAGVSTESGLKDFRGENGLYKSRNEYNYPPEYMLSNKCLLENPLLFYDYYRKNMDFRDAQPNECHKYLKRLEDKGKLKAIITQNIDGLHQKAGSRNVLEIHGTTDRYYCMKCQEEYDKSIIYESKDVPRCKCGAIIRPDVVLYGEMLKDSYDDSIRFISCADLLIVGGTSLTVFPASGLINYFRGRNIVIINKDSTMYDDISTLVINKSIGEVFSNLH